MDKGQFVLHAELEDSHWWFRARREIIIGLLSRELPPGKGCLVAEIGCGTGGNLKLLSEHYRCIGVDISPEAVAYARERVNCPIYLGDFREQLADTWGVLDAVILADVLEHVEDDSVFLADIVKKLRPGALLIMTVPANRFLWDRHDVVLGHLRRYSRPEFIALWRHLDMEELLVTYFNAILFPVIAFVRLLKINCTSGNSDLKDQGRFMNALLYRIFSFERYILNFFPMPFGVSLLAMLRKR